MPLKIRSYNIYVHPYMSCMVSIKKLRSSLIVRFPYDPTDSSPIKDTSSSSQRSFLSPLIHLHLRLHETPVATHIQGRFEKSRSLNARENGNRIERLAHELHQNLFYFNYCSLLFLLLLYHDLSIHFFYCFVIYIAMSD
jgi:hypothetical protein